MTLALVALVVVLAVCLLCVGFYAYDTNNVNQRLNLENQFLMADRDKWRAAANNLLTARALQKTQGTASTAETTDQVDG